MDEVLKKLQKVELKILCDFAEFCEKHDIKYSIYAGTALGAVRHGGFIPWDDDIDVYMTRNEYERFLKIYRENELEGYFLQGTDDPNYEYINFSKFRKNGTKFGGKRDLKIYEHNGIYLDIFPLDKVPTDKKLRKKFLFKAKLRMVYTRGYPFTKGSKLLKLISKILLIPSRKTQLKWRNKLEKDIIFKYKDLEKDYEYMSLASSENFNMFFPADTVETFTDILFEGKTFKITAEYDRFLTKMYGDYMKLPPEEQRVCKHESEVYDFGEDN